MKKLIILLLILIPIFSFAQDENLTWDFPAKPGKAGWKNLKTETERLNAMQVPSDVLSNMETEELLITCMNYPAALFYGAYSNNYVGIKKTIEKFNGLQELLKRKDALKCLTKLYKNIGTNGLKQKDSRLNEQFWPLKFRYIELLLIQDAIISSSTDEDVQNLLDVSVEKTKLKTDKPVWFSKSDDLVSSFLVAKSMKKLKINEFTSNKEYMDFVTKGKLKSHEQALAIIELGKKHAKIKNQ
jgi:hypothetical protein